MFYTKYFINEKKYKSFEKGNYFYQSVKQKVIHYKEKKHYGNKFKVTILEQTLIDCINKPLYCGGFEELFRSLSSLKLNKKNYEKLIELLKEYNYKNLYNKVGFTFDELNKAFRLNTPSWFFDEIKKNMNVKNYQLLEKTWEKGNIVKNKIWKIKYNKNLYSTLKGFY